MPDFSTTPWSDPIIPFLVDRVVPILLVVIGGAVLFLALAIFLPWWNLIDVFKAGGG